MVEWFDFDVLNYHSFPSEYWRRIRTTDLIECVNKEFKRRCRSIEAFPNDALLLRIDGDILMDINEKWIISILIFM